MRATERFTIRDATADDLPDLRATLTAAIEPYRDVAPSEIFEAYLGANLNIESRLATSEVLVLIDGDEIAGTVTLVMGGHDESAGVGTADLASLRAMAVHPRAQGSGAAKALVQECARRARAAGATAITLHTAPFLGRAISFYERVGFRRDPDHDIPASQALGVDLPTTELMGLAYRLDLT